MNERHLLIFLIVLVIAANLVVGGYLWWSDRSNQYVATIGRTIAQDQGLLAFIRMTRVNPDQVLFPTITKTGTIRFWDEHAKALSESRLDGGQYQTLAQLTGVSFRAMAWAPNGQIMAALVDDSKTNRWRLFDVRTQLFTPLPERTLSVAFSPRSDEVAYLEHDGTSGRITVAFTDGSGSKTLMATRLTNAKLFWPTQDFLALIIADDDGYTRALYTLGLDGQLRRIGEARPQLEATWSPDGSRVLISWFGENNVLSTSIITLAGNQEYPLSIATLASKCAWYTNSAFVCGVPKTPLSSEGYGRAVVQDTLALVRMGADGTWDITTHTPAQSLSVNEMFARGTVGIVSNAYDGLLWSFIAPY